MNTKAEPMYTSFSIQNFRGFEHLELKDLARVNLIAGKNNTGKTSILEALFIHSGNFSQEALLRVEEISEHTDAIFRYVRPRQLPQWNVLFNDLDVSKNIRFLSNNKNKSNSNTETQLQMIYFDAELYEKEQDNLGLIPTSFDTSFQGKQVLKVTYQTRPYHVFQQEGRVVLDKFLPKPVVDMFFIKARKKISEEENAGKFSNLKIKRRDQLVIDTLRLIEPRLNELLLLSYSGFPIIYTEIGLNEPIPLLSLGEGVDRIASFILAIGNANGGVVLIDEIENGLHYSVLPDVWRAIGKAAREFNVQIFATTHSLECINAAKEAFYENNNDDFRYHRLDRKKSGEIQAVTYDPETLESSLESNLEVR